MKMRVGRTTLGLAISLVMFAGVFPFAFGIVAVLIDRVFALPLLFATLTANIVTAALILFGIFWIFWAYSYLLFVGGGSPFEAFGLALEPTKVLVTTGPYAYTRNPAVFGLLWVLGGVAVQLRSMGGLILLPIVALIILGYLKVFEEPALERRFGASYRHYEKHVPLLFPRWITYIKPEAVETSG